MKTAIKYFAIFMLVVSLLANSAPPLPAKAGSDFRSITTPSAEAVVNVAHFAPFAPDLADTAVTVRLNGEDALNGFEFGETVIGLSLEPGEYLVEIIPDILGTVAISGTFELAADTQYTLAAIGDGVNQPLELFALVDETVPAIEAAKLRLAHLAPWAAGDALVDICADGSDTPLIANFGFKDFTDPYLELPAGNYNLLIAVAGTDCGAVALDIPSITLAAGEIADAFAIGDIANYDLQIATITGINFTTAVVNVAHFAPFAAALEDTSVSVYLNGEEAISDFVFGEIVPGVELLVGEYLVEIVPTGSITPAITGIFMLDDLQYTLAAIGDGVNQPLELFALVDETELMFSTAPQDGTAKLRIAHLAPWAAGDALVDICTDNGTAILSDFGYKDFTNPYLDLPAGAYDLLIAVAGTDCEAVALDLPSVVLLDGTVTDVFAIGGANGHPLTIASITGIIPAKIVFLPYLAK